MQHGLRAAVVTPFFADRDAVGNDVHRSAQALRELGREVKVFAIGGSSTRETLHPIDGLASYLRQPDDLLYYHFSTGRREVTRAIEAIACRRWMKFHNITPPELFSIWSDELAEASRVGREELRAVCAISWERVWAASAFNLADIAPFLLSDVASGVLPPFHDTESLIGLAPESLPQSLPSLLNVGRIAPSKGHPFLLRVMRYLVHDLRVEATLDIVGKPDHRLAAYQRMLELIVSEYRLEPYVRFHGEVSDDTLARHYAGASAFVMTSDHEGFCVPIVEAMAFRVPVVALGTSAIPETVADAGVVWNERDPRRFAVTLAGLIGQPEQARALGELGRERFERHFARNVIEQRFKEAVTAGSARGTPANAEIRR